MRIETNKATYTVLVYLRQVSLALSSLGVTYELEKPIRGLGNLRIESQHAPFPG